MNHPRICLGAPPEISAIKPGIALCGAPGSGKTEVAHYLCAHHAYRLIDDGLPLRRIVVDFYRPWGVLPSDPFTQAGKARTVTVAGQSFTVRKLLGEVGNEFEHLHGDTILAERACLEVLLGRDEPLRQVVFASVRKNQGWVYRQHGGVVVEIRRPGYGFTYDFDRYDQDAVQRAIDNDGTLEDLRAKVETLIRSL